MRPPRREAGLRRRGDGQPAHGHAHGNAYQACQLGSHSCQYAARILLGPLGPRLGRVPQDEERHPASDPGHQGIREHGQVAARRRPSHHLPRAPHVEAAAARGKDASAAGARGPDPRPGRDTDVGVDPDHGGLSPAPPAVDAAQAARRAVRCHPGPQRGGAPGKAGEPALPAGRRQGGLPPQHWNQQPAPEDRAARDVDVQGPEIRQGVEPVAWDRGENEPLPHRYERERVCRRARLPPGTLARGQERRRARQEAAHLWRRHARLPGHGARTGRAVPAAGQAVPALGSGGTVGVNDDGDRRAGDLGVLRIYQSTPRDCQMAADYFVPIPYKISFTFILPLFPKLLEFYRDREAPSLAGHGPPTLLSQVLGGLNRYKAAFARRIDSRHDIVLLGGAMGSLLSLLQAMASQAIGRFSDRYGRRAALLASMCGNTVSVLLWVVAVDFRTFVASRVVGGLSEGNVQLATAIASDISDDASRGSTMTIIGACFSVAFTFGPALGAWLSTMSAVAANPFVVAAGFSLALVVAETTYLYLCLPETLPALAKTEAPGSNGNASASSKAKKRAIEDKKNSSPLLYAINFFLLFSGMEDLPVLHDLRAVRLRPGQQRQATGLHRTRGLAPPGGRHAQNGAALFHPPRHRVLPHSLCLARHRRHRGRALCGRHVPRDDVGDRRDGAQRAEQLRCERGRARQQTGHPAELGSARAWAGTRALHQRVLVGRTRVRLQTGRDGHRRGDGGRPHGAQDAQAGLGPQRRAERGDGGGQQAAWAYQECTMSVAQCACE